MSGTACVRGEAGDTYRAPRAKTDPAVWPPKYTKAVLTFAEDSPDAVEVGEWAFCDARRLGRIKLVHGDDPHLVPPLSLLGELFSQAVLIKYWLDSHLAAHPQAPILSWTCRQLKICRLPC